MTILQISQVSKTFASQGRTTQALLATDVSVAENDFITILGPSGCGKSTLMRLIAGLHPATTGRIEVSSKPVNGPVSEVGIVFQSPVLLEWRNILDNVLFQADMRGLNVGEYKERAMQLLHQVGLQDFADRYPHELSGGMRQRASIARALLHNPPLLLMDEPFGALDSQTRSNMQNLLLDVLQREGKTVMLITHSVDEAIYLSSKIFVVTARPARIKEIIEVPFGYPRHEELHDDSRFVSLKARLRGLVMEEYEAQQRLSIKEV